MNDFEDVNKALWNLRVRSHVGSTFYQESEFRRGQTTLNPIERDLLGALPEKRLIHLQCHFGIDTLSLAREGAIVTGVDYAEEAIRYAETLKHSVGLPATFICANIDDLPPQLDGSFDVVFTSYGVLHWLPSLERWAQTVRRLLVTGGIFVLVEFHPLEMLFDDSGLVSESYVYSSGGEPIRRVVTGTYADPAIAFEQPAFNWRYGVGEVVNALVQSGLRLESFTEYPFTYYWGKPRTPDKRPARLPRLYSIKARAE